MSRHLCNRGDLLTLSRPQFHDNGQGNLREHSIQFLRFHTQETLADKHVFFTTQYGGLFASGRSNKN